MRNPLYPIRALSAANENYFRRDADTILDFNRRTLVRVCSLYTVLLLCYEVLVHFYVKNRLLDWIYILFLLVQLILDYASHPFFWKSEKSFSQIQALCFLQSFFIMAFIIILSTLPFPDAPSIFFSPVLIAVSILFNLPLWQLSISACFYVVLFLAFGSVYKTQEAFTYDLWAAFPALIIALVSIYTLADLRVRDFHSRFRWMLLSRMDQHTRLFNKSTVEKLFKAHLLHAAFGERCALLLLDLDDFKSINDSLGHAQGDIVLQETAEAIRSCLHSDDIAGRFGGDEFVLLFTNLSHAKAARLRASRLAEEITNRCAARFPDQHVTCSVGISFGSAGCPYESFFVQADAALYIAKAQGKGRVMMAKVTPKGFHTYPSFS